MAASNWAVTQISRLLPLDDDSLRQIVDYSSGLSKDAAAEHLKNLLGDSPQALEFITSFNSRRSAPAPAANPPSQSEIPSRPKPHRKKAPLNKLPPPRRPEDYGNTAGAYQKKVEEDYMPSSHRRKDTALANTLSLSATPAALQHPVPKLPPSAAGSLLSDLPNVRTTSRPSSYPTSRTSSPVPKTAKIALSGGMPMHGASTTLTDLDHAIRSLEIQTNPSLSSSHDVAARRCDCQAGRHPLLAAAPNCLACGKIICVKEGLGPCTFCGAALLASADIQAMVKVLREERGKEKMDANNAPQRRAEVSKVLRPFQAPITDAPLHSFSSSKSESVDAPLAAARQHRDKLLTYQAQNARRTHVIDEAADFETPTSGQSMWSSPVERAAQLKRQQKVLREQEWNAQPEYEKRRIVVSVDLVGGKVVRRMGKVEREKEPDEDEDGDQKMDLNGETSGAGHNGEGKGTGAFGRNPLLGSLIKPVWKKAKGKYRSDDSDSADKENREQQFSSKWRRVQDDFDDNEAVILDGGIYGGREGERGLGQEEHAVG
ncbi:hypothetical protein MMC34_003504 [Xylographa carneopallida]|nr:hypothetical protein [Xylographa carneopallida]